MDINGLLAEYGFPITIAIYFLWRDIKRSKEDRKDKKELAERLRELEDYNKDKLEKLVISTNDAIASINRLCERLIASNDSICAALLSRRCIAEDVAEIRRDAN